MNQQLGGRRLVVELIAGVVVFLVALPLCLGIALASGASLFSGLVAGIVGGIIVGLLSGSSTSVSGPAAGLTAIVADQIMRLGSFNTFLFAIFVGGVIQIALGMLRAGTLSAFVPSSVIKGLLAAIGIILILKQLPHLLGHDNDPEGEMEFYQPDHENTISEILRLFQGEIHNGAVVVGLVSIAILVLWDRIKPLKKSIVPSPLIVVIVGLIIAEGLKRFGGGWLIEGNHLVAVPVAEKWEDMQSFIQTPDWSQFSNWKVYLSGLVIAIVASLETLLNLEAIDKLDPLQRRSPPNRELIAQGVGNITCGLIGGIPVTSVIVRSSVNINSGARTKISAVFHGVLLLFSVIYLPQFLNRIPIACLAGILLVTGWKLASPRLFKEMVQSGPQQAIPFFLTMIAIVFTDLLIGIGIGMTISVAFILFSNIRRPIQQVVEKHASGDITHVQLANQVSFLNRAALEDVLYNAPAGTHFLLDAADTDYIDPDVLSLLRDFKQNAASVRNVTVSTKGFKNFVGLEDDIKFPVYSTQELQQRLSPKEILGLLEAGNERFRLGTRLTRDLGRQIHGTSTGQHPLAVILSCIDSRSPAELIFDVGLGDIFTVRIAGNVVRSKVMGSIEYACSVAGAKLIIVMGHTHCGAVNSTVDLIGSGKGVEQATGCQHLDLIVHEISKSIPLDKVSTINLMSSGEKRDFANEVAARNVRHAVQVIVNESQTIQRLLDQNRIAIVGAMYDISNGQVTFYDDTAIGLHRSSSQPAVASGGVW